MGGKAVVRGHAPPLSDGTGYRFHTSFICGYLMVASSIGAVTATLGCYKIPNLELQDPMSVGLSNRDGVEDTRLEATFKDKKKIRGQGHPY